MAKAQCKVCSEFLQVTGGGKEMTCSQNCSRVAHIADAINNLESTLAYLTEVQVK